MKKLGILQSNRGHNEIDYLVSVSVNELRVIKTAINHFKSSDNHTRNTKDNIKTCINKIIKNEKVDK